MSGDYFVDYRGLPIGSLAEPEGLPSPTGVQRTTREESLAPLRDHTSSLRAGINFLLAIGLEFSCRPTARRQSNVPKWFHHKAPGVSAEVATDCR